MSFVKKKKKKVVWFGKGKRRGKMICLFDLSPREAGRATSKHNQSSVGGYDFLFYFFSKDKISLIELNGQNPLGME